MNNKSFALILVLFIMLAFSLLGLTAINIASQMNYYFVNQINYLRAYYAAEAVKNLYLEDILYANSLTNSAYNETNFAENLGSATCSIVYESRATRVANILFRGQSQTTQFNRPLKIEENSQFTAGTAEVPTPTIVDNLRRFNFMALSSSATMLFFVDSLGCWLCSCGVMCHDGFVGCTPSSRTFMANTYFGQTIKSKGGFIDSCGAYCGCSTVPIYGYWTPPICTSGSGKTAAYDKWGTPGNTRNLYVNGTVNLSEIKDPAWTSPATDYGGVYGTVYSKAAVVNPRNVGSFAQVNCVTNPTNPGCQNWPPASLTLNTAYFNAELARAAVATATPVNLAITTSHVLRQLNNRNVYVNGNVTITTSSIYPLTGPGNIVATGTITVNSPSYIGENVGLIAAGNITIAGAAAASRVCVGGTYVSGSDAISGAGALLYSSTGTIDIGYNSRVKVFAMGNKSKLNFQARGSMCQPSGWAQLQGLLYSQTLDARGQYGSGTGWGMGIIYGYFIVDDMPAVVENSYPSTMSLGFGNISDTYPWGGQTISDLPLKIRGLYNILAIKN